MKEVYMSAQIDQDKENRQRGLTEIKVSSFQGEQQKQLGSEFGDLMKKFNLNIEEFREVILHYAKEQRKVLEQL